MKARPYEKSTSSGWEACSSLQLCLRRSELLTTETDDRAIDDRQQAYLRQTAGIVVDGQRADLGYRAHRLDQQ